MRKYLFPLAAVLGWSLALAVVSTLDAMDAEREASRAVVADVALKK